MKHLDEGTLQAWLDGPRSGLQAKELDEIARHVAECETCAGRADELRTSTERTMSLLTTPAAGGRPPFSAVRARAADTDRAEGPAPRAPMTRWRWRTTSWAASIAVALGAGWLANDLYRRPGGGGGAMATIESAAPIESAPATAELSESAPATVELSESAPATVEPGPVADELAPRAEERGVAADEALASIEIPPPPAPRAAAPPAAGRLPSIEAEAEEVARRADGAAREAVSRERMAAGLLPVQGRVVDATTGRPLESAQVFIPSTQEGALTDADGRFTLFVDSALATRTDELSLAVQLIGYGEAMRPLDALLGDSAPAEIAMSATALRLQELVVTGARAPQGQRAAEAAVAPARRPDPAVWSPATRSQAETAAGFALLTVPALEVQSIDVGSDGEVVIVRVVQTLDEGERLTLIQTAQPLGAEATREAARSPETDGARETPQDPPPGPLADRLAPARQVGTVWVAAVAPLSAEALEELLARLR